MRSVKFTTNLDKFEHLCNHHYELQVLPKEGDIIRFKHTPDLEVYRVVHKISISPVEHDIEIELNIPKHLSVLDQYPESVMSTYFE